MDALAGTHAPPRERAVVAGVRAVLRPAREVLRFRELLVLLVARDLKARYKRSALGTGWTLLNPLLQMGVYSLVFAVVLRIGVPDYPLFVLSGLLPWSLLAVGTTSASLSLLGNQGLIRKVAVPQAVYPLAVVGGKLVDAALSVPALAILALASGRPPGASWLLLPVAFAIATAFTSGLALLLASLTVFFRDLRHLVELLFQIWFYVTPVFYPASFLEKVPVPALRWVLAANPATPVVRLFQETVYEGRAPPLATIALALLAAASSLAVGGLVFARAEHRHIHYL
jgi:lipopolysaccharide transport system permease protein